MTLDGQTAAVLGLGLIGGSLARDLAALGVRVFGYDVDAATLDDARAEGIVAECLDASLAGLEDASIVLIAIPVSATHGVLAGVARQVGRESLVMDVGSTKRTAIAAAASLGITERFVGSHPMTGDHRSGWSASRRGLFEGATVYLCSTEDARNDARDLAQELWTALGARVEWIDAGVHDSRVAFTSHLPHTAAAAIALALSGAGVRPGELGPGGRDVLRIAASSADTWAAIATDNAEAILHAMSDLETQLQRFHAALSARDSRALHELFAAARTWASEVRPPR